MDVRTILVQYLTKNPNINGMRAKEYIYSEKRMSLDEYIAFMKLPSSWGGAIEIKIYCDVFGRNVIVVSQHNYKNIEFFSKKKTNIWDLIHWNGSHYVPIKTITK
jgi:hypothetical protein